MLNEGSVVRKIMWRILPLTFLLFVVQYLDRVNLGYAALQMNGELGLSSEAFGFAAGIFFIGNLFFEVPSNILMKKYGARRWLTRIILSWAVVSALTAFVTQSWQLYVLRFLLGVAEAGFYPGVIYFYSFWFREKERAFAVATFSAAVPVTYLLGAPLSTWLMQEFSNAALSGWRWMMFVEALPAIIGGVICFKLVPDSPDKARWLSAEEKTWLAREFEKEAKEIGPVKHLGNLQALMNPTILHMALIYFLVQAGGVGISYWLPQIVRALNREVSLTTVGWLAAAPYLATAIISVLWGRASDFFRERKLFSAVPLILAGVALYAAGNATNPIVILTMIGLSLVAGYAMHAPFFSSLTQIVSRPTVAVASAVVVSLGNLGGFAGTYFLGFAKRTTGSDSAGYYVLGGALMLAAVLMMMLSMKRGTSRDSHVVARDM
jgi:ACS family tartrate transporter-like MFS transporter